MASASTRRRNRDLKVVDPAELEASGRQKHRTSSLSASSREGKQKNRSHSRAKSREAAGLRTLEGFGSPLCGASSAEDRDHLRGLEVTQYFFEAVLAQVKRWYEERVQEAQLQAQQRAQAEKAALMERITCLEAELHLLRTNQQDS